MTTLLIPGLNDSDDELDRAVATGSREQLGPDVPLHFTAFHPDFQHDRRARRRRPHAGAARARSRARAGLRYVYVGNVHDADGQTTYCRALRRGR